MRGLIARWIINAIAVWAAVYVVNNFVARQVEGIGGISMSNDLVTLGVVAAILGLVNALVRPIVAGLSGCLIVLTFGLFMLVINALLLMATSWLVGQVGYQFVIHDFLTALVAALIISIVSMALSMFAGE